MSKRTLAVASTQQKLDKLLTELKIYSVKD